MKRYNVAILGATGAVGREMMKVLEERQFPIAQLKLLASSRSAGKTILFNGREQIIEEAREDSFDGVDIVLGAAENDIAMKYLPIAAAKGAVVVDNSSAYRLDDDVPLIIPEINPQDVHAHHGIIANPNCSTIQAMVALKPLDDKYKIKRVVYSTYQAVSGAGVAGWKDLENGMKGEVERCRDALAAAAAGATVCMVCSGDPGILAMAGLLFELRAREQAFRDLPIRVLPGITAASTAAAALGAPLQNGFSLVSLSDLLVPADEVRRNLRAVAQSALPVTLYNPAGRKRRRLLAEALDIFREARGGDILCAFVRHAGRPEETRWIGRLADLPADDVDMSTLVLIGSARTVTDQGALFEARGYAEKYLDKDAPASTADGR